MAPLLGAPGARGPRFIEPPEPTVPTPLHTDNKKIGLHFALTVITDPRFATITTTKLYRRKRRYLLTDPSFVHKILHVTSLSQVLLIKSVYNIRLTEKLHNGYDSADPSVG